MISTLLRNITGGLKGGRQRQANASNRTTAARASFIPESQGDAAADRFFRSLAQDRHERVICTLLSGTGSDGLADFVPIGGRALDLRVCTRREAKPVIMVPGAYCHR